MSLHVNDPAAHGNVSPAQTIRVLLPETLSARGALGPMDLEIASGIVEGEVGTPRNITADFVDAQTEDVTGFVHNIEPLAIFTAKYEHDRNSYQNVIKSKS
jgi:hypothetical protein